MLRHLDDDFYLSSESSGSARSRRGAMQRRHLRVLVIGTYNVASPLCAEICAVLQASDCYSGLSMRVRTRTFR